MPGMLYISDETIERWIKEDVPYIDLTTLTLGISDKIGKIKFKAREYTILSGVEEVLRIFKKLGITANHSLASGTQVNGGDIFLEAEGTAARLHMAWKVSLNLLEYCSGIATRTKILVDKAKAANSDISILTTRKSFPGTKELAIKSILAGGAYPHRLGLSETLLIFKNHFNFLGGIEGIIPLIKQIKVDTCEKKIIVEVENEEDALLLASIEVDGLQFDKISPQKLKEIVPKIRHINPEIKLLAAGGINESNISEYAYTGVDAIVTTSVYFGKPSNIGVEINPNE